MVLVLDLVYLKHVKCERTQILSELYSQAKIKNYFCYCVPLVWCIFSLVRKSLSFDWSPQELLSHSVLFHYVDIFIIHVSLTQTQRNRRYKKHKRDRACHLALLDAYICYLWQLEKIQSIKISVLFVNHEVKSIKGLMKVSFLLLWQNTWDNQLNWGKDSFDSQFWRFHSMVNWILQ